MTLRVLVVEDSGAIRVLLAQILANHGYHPVEASSAERALHLAFSDPPGVAVIDHHPPGLSGAELIRTLRASGVGRLRTIPVVGISGFPGTERDLLTVGADAFVRKPFCETELLDAVEAARASRLVDGGRR